MKRMEIHLSSLILHLSIIMEITLNDNRLLTYAEYGIPNGNPIFFFHGMPGSHLFRPSDEVTSRLGVRLITADRPGYGQSTFQPNRRIIDWAEDIAQLADHLGIDKFSVAGHSGGGPYAAACAYALPGRVKAAALIATAGPLDSPDALEHMESLNRMGFRVGRYIPWWIWRMLIWYFYHDGRDRPEKVMERDAASRPRADAELWKIDSIRKVCYASAVEGFRHGTKGHAWEARLLTRPWNLPIEKIRVPVHLWHGTRDRTTTIEMARHLADKIPNSHLHVCDDEAHLLIFPHWEEILLKLMEQG
jgi:pimeloyl-ACP methyl ester carboxylesterase